MSDNRGIAIITGGGSGIGQATAFAMAADGWTVVVAGRRQEALDETVAGASGARPVEAVQTDVTDSASIDRLFATVLERHGRLDFLFNNAGMNVPKIPLDELGTDQLRTIVETNLLGSLLCSRAAMKAMKAQTPQGGRIVNNGSVSSYAPRLNTAPYTSTKHAITGLTKAITVDGRPFGIVCGQIDVGNAVADPSVPMANGDPQANGSVVFEPRIPTSQVAEMVAHMARLPLDANVPFLTVMASTMPLYGRG